MTAKNATDLQAALIHHQAGRYNEAQQLYETILNSNPRDVNALHLLGVLHNAKEQYETGILYIFRALELAPGLVEAYYNLGNALSKINRQSQAITAYDNATSLNPEHKNAWLNKGDAYRVLQKMVQAEECYRRALQLDPDNYHLHVRLGAVLRYLDRPAEAHAAYLRALEINPAASDANYNLGNMLNDANKPDQALQYFRRAAASRDANPRVTGSILACLTKTCSWDDELMQPRAWDALQAQVLPPFTTLVLPFSARMQLHHARRFVEHINSLTPPAAPVPHVARPRQGAGKIRIGYLSADFHQHATAYLAAQLFEVHDREHFEIVGISSGIDDHSSVRKRLVESFDVFLDVAKDDDTTAAQRIADAGIDILVDLKGHTQNARLGILMRRPAPLAVSYLGFPGTMGTRAIDYILADATVLPFEDQTYYDEKIVHLPNCYQVNDAAVETSMTPTTRDQHGLPAGAFVFCCLNGSHKIRPAIFEAWMRVLAAVPHGVLWLYHDNGSAIRNLQRAAVARGIDPTRLIFAPKLAHDQHLERYRHADLFLDTSPYNAHTTGSDALRAHVPLLTVRGSTFASRVAASLLHAVGVPELVAENLAAYEAEACRLAHDRAALAAIRERIAEGVRSGPLYDARRFARGIEAAYRHMQARTATGLPPCAFAVQQDGIIQEQEGHAGENNNAQKCP